MDYSLSQLHVIPTGNTLPTTGSTNNLTTYRSEERRVGKEC